MCLHTADSASADEEVPELRASTCIQAAYYCIYVSAYSLQRRADEQVPALRPHTTIYMCLHTAYSAGADEQVPELRLY